tara:strand:- start:955 stop:1344 length:390 start_codon:yes stop_codon:yes gene_type:complete
MDGRKFQNKEDLIKLLEVNDEDNFQGLIDAISSGNEELIEDEVFTLDFKFIQGHQCSDEWVNALIILIKHCIDNQYTGSYQIINIFPPNWEKLSNTGQQLILNLCKNYKNNKFNELTQLVMLQILGESW